MKRQKIFISAFLIICTMAFAGCGSAGNGNEDALSVDTITADEIADEVVKEATDENAEEQNMDGATGDVTDEAIATGLSFNVPSGMRENEDIPGYYVSEHYADDYASVFYQESNYDDRYSLLTEETIAELMQAMYSDTYGIDTVIDVKAFNRINFDGYEGYYLSIEYNVDDVIIESEEYSIISGDKIYSITYAQKKDSGWHVKYEQSVNSLQVR